jgi:hypothetical protein
MNPPPPPFYRRYLNPEDALPPPKPNTDSSTYEVFGETQSTHLPRPRLQDQNQTQLYADAEGQSKRCPLGVTEKPIDRSIG